MQHSGTTKSTMEGRERKHNTARNIHVINEGREESEENAFRELEGADKTTEDVEDTEDDIHIKARELFNEAASLECQGKLYEAIRFYKKAEFLVPDVERQTFAYNAKIFEKQEQKRRENESSDPDHNENGTTSIKCNDVDDNKSK